MNRALAYLPAASCCRLADRESIGAAWLRHLLKQSVDFVIRLRSNHAIKRANGRVQSLGCITRCQPKNTTWVYENVALYEPPNVVIHSICHRPAGGTRLFLAITRTDFDAGSALYKQRRAAETALGFLKAKDFDLETTRLRKPQRVLRLLSILAIALLGALCVGQHLHQHEPTLRSCLKTRFSFRPALKGRTH